MKNVEGAVVMNDRILTVREAAEYMRVSERTIRDWVKSGRLASVPIGKREYRIQQSAIDKFIEDQKKQGHKD